MVNKKSLATFVRTVGNQVISGFKHFLNNVKIGGDLIIDPNSLGAPATNVLTVDGSGVVKTATAFSGISVDSVSKVKHEVKAGVAINKGQAVYVTGADGTNMIVGLASNATEATSSKTMGLLESTVAINGKTNVITEGLLSGLDTSMASAGDVVWLGTGGNLLYGLANKPYAPAHLVFIGIVTRSNSNNGEIFVKVQNGFELNEIHDVDLKTTVPVNGHILGFDGTLWVNKTIAGWLGYTPANAANESNWNAAYNDKINSAAVTGTTTKTLTLTQQDGGTITASWTDINTDAVTSVFGRTGAVVATSGDYTTAQVTESGNLYFTNARGIGSTLTGYASGAGVISSADTILSAIQKLNGNIGALVTGVSSVNGLSGAVTLTTTNIAEGTNLYYTEARVNANTNVAANTAARHNAVTIGTANGLSLSTQVLSLGLASASTNGALSSTDWTTFNSKQAALNGTGFVKITGTTISYDNSTYYLASNPNGYTSNVGTVTSITATAGTGISISGSPITTSGTLTITNTAPDQTVVLTSGTGISVTGTYPNFTITNSSPSSGGTVTSIATTAPITGGTITSTGTIGITQAGASTDGYLSSTDWNTFNNKQPALTNPITGTGTTNYLSKFTGSTTLGNSQIFDNGTSVGIGTATPAVELAIYQSTTPRLHLQNSTSGTASNKGFQVALSGTAGYLWNFQNGATIFATNNTERLRITADGNVGIGTTSPSALLHVAKSQTSDTAIMVSNLGTVGASTTLSFVLAESTTPQGWFRRYRDGSANTEIGFSNSLLFTGSVTGTKAERMRITDAGNVGIGTTSPTQKLDVVGTGATNVRIASDSTAETSLHFGNTTGGRVSVRSNAYLALDTNATERMRIDASGNVGIGTTTPAHKLSVVGSGTGIAHIGDAGFGSGNYVGASFNGTLSTTNYNILSSPTNPHLYLNRPAGKEIKFREDNTEQMTILSGGNVGIGTTLPAQKLHVNSGNIRIDGGSYNLIVDHGANSGGVGVVLQSTGSNLPFLRWTDGTNINAGIRSNSSSSLIFQTNGFNDRLTINSSGNVGIGTTSPNITGQAGSGTLTVKNSSTYGVVEIAGSSATQGGVLSFFGNTTRFAQLAGEYSSANNGMMIFRTLVSGTITENIRIVNGNIGIGTTSPAQKLDVNGYITSERFYPYNSNSTYIYGDTAGLVIGGGGYFYAQQSGGSYFQNITRFRGGISNDTSTYLDIQGGTSNITYFNGSIGIGTTSPSEKLSVIGGNISLGAGYKLQYSSTAYITPENNVSGAEIATGGVLTIKTGGTTERVRVDASGNVGIGTVNPGAKLDVVGSAGIRVNEDGIGTKVISIRSDFAGVDPAINVSTNNALLLQTNNTERMRITSTGNVGIGTTSPGNLLTIGGNTRIVTGTTQGLFAYDASTGGAFIWSLTRYTDSNANDLNVNTRNGFGIRVGVTSLTNSGHQFYINNSGNVGIGTTSPTGKLSVVGDGTEYSNIVLRHGSNQEHLIYASTNIQYNLIGSGAPTWIWGQQGGAERMRLNNTGLGIGTASPQAKLDVTDGDFIVRDDANVNRVVLTRFGGIELKGNGTSFRTVGTPNTDALSLATNNTSRIYITSAGNVGIGTTSPAFKLDINGASNSSPFRVLSTNTTSLRTFFEATSGNVEQHFLYTGNQDWVLGLDKADSNKFKLASADDGFASAKLTVTTSGNVGIGTSSPAARLNIAGNLGSTVGGGNSAIKMTNTDTGNFASISAGIVGITNSGMEFSVDGNRAAVISGTGNVGIGTTSPATRLHVDASGHALVVSNDTGNRRIYFGTGTLGEPDIQAALSNGTARELSINAAGGNVGIGVVSPTQKLHVSGNIRVTGAYYDSSNSAGSSGQVLSSTGSGTDWVSLSEITGVDGTGTANYVAKWSDADTIANSQIFDNGTNVGIGTATPTNKFQIGSISGYNGNAFAIGNGTDQFAIFQASSFTQFYTNGGFLFATGNTESVRITSTGNVGIGTTSPGYKLEVSGTVYINGDGDLLFDGSTGGDGFQMDYYNGQMYLGNKLGTSWHMVMKDNGNVGIGTTSPDSKLHISTTSSNPFRMVRTGGAATNFGYEFGNGAIGLYDYTNSSYRYYITSGGNVGIGTTSPNGKLEIVANPTGNTVLLGRTGGTSSIKALSDNGGYLALDSTGGATILNHYVSDNVWLVTGGGNVGIGTTSPNEKLTVSGKGYFNPYYPIVLTGKGSPEYGTNITLASDTGSTQGAVRIWSRYDGTGYAATTFERATTSQAYSSDPQLLTYSESMRISGAGNVGIGTTSPNITGQAGSGTLTVKNSSTYGVVEIAGSSATQGGVLSFFGNTTRFAQLAGEYSSANNGMMIFRTLVSGTITENIRIVNGNVGIGTTSPSQKLHVNGNIIIPQNNYLYFDNTAHYIRRGSSNVEISGFNGINLITSGSTRVIVTEAGNVGIGTTSPSHKLQVVTNAVAGKQNMAAIDRTAGNLIRFTNPQYSTDASMGLLLRVFPDSDARQGAGIIASGGANNATTDLDLFVTTSPDGLGGTSYSAVKINGLNGNVGIGTTSPSAKLQVGGSTKITGGDWPTANAGLEFNYVGNTSYIGSYDRTNSVYKGLFLFADNMTFETGASIRMYITSGGNVGIGTTSPSAKLHVIGNATVSATLSTANAKISGTLADSFNQVGTAGQVLSSTGNGIEWITGGGGGGGSTIIVKDEGTTIGSSFTTLDFVGNNIQASASGSTAVVTAYNNAGTGSIYANDTATQYAPTASFANVEINSSTIEASAPDTAGTTQKLIAIVTFGVDNVSNYDGFNNFDFRLYNSSASSAIADTTHSWCSYMSKGEFEKRTVFTFHIPLYDGVGASDTIIVQAQQSTAYTPEIYYCALTLMEGTN